MTITIGTRVEIIDGHEAYHGKTATVVAETGRPSAPWKIEVDEPPTKRVCSDPHGGGWKTENLRVLEATPARPLIDFSASRYATARQYASAHISTVNQAETNETLLAVADGKQVDAYALARAVLDAMRGATTRCGQSMGRRRHATEIAHLGHIAHAVIENHADGLPAYAEGERSRQIEALQAANTELRADREALKGAVEQAKAEIERSTEALADEVRATQASADAEAARLVALAERRQEAVDAAHAEMNEYSAALDYAFSLLNDEQQQRLAGFRDGYGQRINDEA